jgi:hypothetical protein
MLRIRLDQNFIHFLFYFIKSSNKIMKELVDRCPLLGLLSLSFLTLSSCSWSSNPSTRHPVRPSPPHPTPYLLCIVDRRGILPFPSKRNYHKSIFSIGPSCNTHVPFSLKLGFFFHFTLGNVSRDTSKEKNGLYTWTLKATVIWLQSQ